MRNEAKKINPITLKIVNEEWEKAYRIQSMDDGLGQFRFAVSLGIIYYIAFIFIDYHIFKDVFHLFLKIKILLVIPTFAIALVLTFFKFYKKFARYINLMTLMIAGVSIILMLSFSAGASSIYLLNAYMLMIFFLMYSFLKLPYRDAFFLGIVLSAGYLLTEWYLNAPEAVWFLYHFAVYLAVNIIGTSVAYVMELSSKKEFLLRRELSESAIRDALTGLYNRHYFEQVLEQDLRGFISRSMGVRHIERRLGDVRAAKYGMFLLDIDHFKRINDTFGHQSGDLVLKEFAELLKSHVRRSDDVLRFGGEEFLIVLKLTTEDYLVSFMKMIGETIAAHDFHIEGGAIIGCTVSIGMVVVPCTKADRVTDLIKYTDRALYKAKGNGRNRGFRAYELQDEIEFEEILWDDLNPKEEKKKRLSE